MNVVGALGCVKEWLLLLVAVPLDLAFSAAKHGGIGPDEVGLCEATG